MGEKTTQIIVYLTSHITEHYNKVFITWNTIHFVIYKYGNPETFDTQKNGLMSSSHRRHGIRVFDVCICDKSDDGGGASYCVPSALTERSWIFSHCISIHCPDIFVLSCSSNYMCLKSHKLAIWLHNLPCICVSAVSLQASRS